MEKLEQRQHNLLFIFLSPTIIPLVIADVKAMIMEQTCQANTMVLKHRCGIAGENRPTCAKFPMEIIDL